MAGFLRAGWRAALPLGYDSARAVTLPHKSSVPLDNRARGK